MMDWFKDDTAELIKGKLYLGRAKKWKKLAKRYKTILNISEMQYGGDRIQYPFKHFGASKEDLIILADLINGLVKAGKTPIYIHCDNGMNRSPLVCAVYLRLYYPKRWPTLLDCVAYIQRKRSIVQIQPQNLLLGLQAVGEKMPKFSFDWNPTQDEIANGEVIDITKEEVDGRAR